MKDLVVLVPDGQMQAALGALMERERSFGIKKPTFDIFSHPERDPGVFGKCHEFLRPFQRLYRFGLVIFDRDGCGSSEPVHSIRQTVIERLDASGWGGRSQVIVIDPELEVWVWADSPNVAKGLGLSEKELQEVLAKHKRDANSKPLDPKGAMDQALRKSRIPRSSSIYAKLAATVSLKNCRDESFASLKSTFLSWFGEQQSLAKPE